MKTFVLSISVILFFSFNFQHQNSTRLLKGEKNYFQNPEFPAFSESVKNYDKNTNPGKENVDQDWYSSAMENIEKEEYNITYSKEFDSYQSPNRKNNIRFIYNKDGFTAAARDLKGMTDNKWEVQLRITNYELRNESSEIVAVGNKAYIENEKIRIDYNNKKDGMRQDFIIKQKPDDSGKLRLNLSADTKLKMIVGADALMFKDKKGIDKMKYSALKCWDANGRELRAYFEKSNYELRIMN